jgi:RNA polymerase sigma-70 factor (ECF subfamily)
MPHSNEQRIRPERLIRFLKRMTTAMAASLPIQSLLTNDKDPNPKDLASDPLPKVAEQADSDEDDDRRPSVDWPGLVMRIQNEDETGMEDLYRLFARGVGFYLRRQLGVQDLDDKVHDVFLIVVQAIRRGELREPDRLMGFVRTVVRRQVAAHIDQVVHSRRNVDVGVLLADGGLNPEQRVVLQQKVDLMREILGRLSETDVEILTRFYLHEETQLEICAGMNLSETQFRLLKSRAKARFGELGKRKLQQKMLVPLVPRIC